MAVFLPVAFLGSMSSRSDIHASAHQLPKFPIGQVFAACCAINDLNDCTGYWGRGGGEQNNVWFRASGHWSAIPVACFDQIAVKNTSQVQNKEFARHCVDSLKFGQSWWEPVKKCVWKLAMFIWFFQINFNGQQLFSHIFTRLGDLHLVLSARWKMQGFRVPRCSGQRRANTPALD